MRQFAAHYGEGLPALDQAVREGRWHEVGAIAHSVKGASATLGADALPARAAALEAAIAGQCPAEEVAAATRLMQDELQRVVSSIHTALAEAVPSGTARVAA